MFRGFYTLTSSMLTENRGMDVIANNFANMGTSGFKADEMVSTTFGNELVRVTANNSLGAYDDLAEAGGIVVLGINTIDYSQGNIDETGIFTDVALLGDGFFTIQTEEGNIYTRNGSFSIDGDGGMHLLGGGPVMGQNGPITVPNDRFQINRMGQILDENGVLIDELAIVDFPDYDAIVKVGEGFFQSPDEPIQDVNVDVIWKATEYSNVDPAEQLTAMMEGQRLIQSASQVLKIYDTLESKAATEIGRV
ncbi:MAG: flagellar hook-basal body protein [Bacillota bacterium]